MAVKKTFSFRITNKYEEDKNICLFQGTLPTMAIAVNSDNEPVLTNANVEAVKAYSLSSVDAVLTDGVLPVMVAGKGLSIPDSSAGTDFLLGEALNSQFSIENFKSYLKSNAFLIEKMIIKTKTQDQFDNPITLQTTSPTESLTVSSIEPTEYSTPEMLNTTKIVIDNLSVVMQDDSAMYWKINAGEVVNITLVFRENQTL